MSCSRKVIFPPEDYWTNKENRMSDYADQPNAADARRAAAVISHHRNNNGEGITAILAEAVEAERPTQLLLAILDLHRSAIVELRTDAGIDLIAAYVAEMATLPDWDGMTDDDADVRRAARLLDAHGRADTEQLNAALQEATRAQRPAHLIVSLLKLYRNVLPELSTAAGVDWLRRCINSFAVEESQ